MCNSSSEKGWHWFLFTFHKCSLIHTPIYRPKYVQKSVWIHKLIWWVAIRSRTKAIFGLNKMKVSLSSVCFILFLTLADLCITVNWRLTGPFWSIYKYIFFFYIICIVLFEPQFFNYMPICLTDKEFLLWNCF